MRIGASAFGMIQDFRLIKGSTVPEDRTGDRSDPNASGSGRKVRTPQGRVLRESEAFRYFGTTESATENKPPCIFFIFLIGSAG